jgi:hypothetical protein
MARLQAHSTVLGGVLRQNRFFEEAGRTRPRLDFREPEFLRRLPPHLAVSHQFVRVVDARKSPAEGHAGGGVVRAGREVPSSSVSSGMREADVVAQLRQFDHMRVLELSQVRARGVRERERERV